MEIPYKSVPHALPPHEPAANPPATAAQQRTDQYPHNLPTTEQASAAGTTLPLHVRPQESKPESSSGALTTRETMRWYCLTHEINGPHVRRIACDRWADEVKSRFLKETQRADPCSANVEYYVQYLNANMAKRTPELDQAMQAYVAQHHSPSPL